MTEPGSLAPQFGALPSDVRSLSRIVQGLLVHFDWLSAYGIDPAGSSTVSRRTLPVGERLRALVAADGRAVHEARAPAQRSVGTCRDFALTLCSFLRSTGTPARVRCGFASYLGEGWEDHWICEYWDPEDGAWRRSDSQLDEKIRTLCATGFDPLDMPPDVFLTAGDAWLRCRTGAENADRFGHGGAKGLWFLKVNVLRDANALNGLETSAWDDWREAPPDFRQVAPLELLRLDWLARNPGAPAVDLTPEWSRR